MSITYGIWKLNPPIPRGDCISVSANKWAELVGNQSVVDAGTYDISGLPGEYDALRFQVDYRQSSDADNTSKIEVYLIPLDGQSMPLTADGYYSLDVRPWQSVYFNRFCMGNYNLPSGRYMFRVNISGEPTQFIRFSIVNSGTQAPRICEEGAFRCDSANNFQQCLNNAWVTLNHCEYGCRSDGSFNGCLPPSGSIDENFYIIYLYTDRNPTIPDWVKTLIRKGATAGGWTVGIINPEPGIGYRIHAVKNGSILIYALIGIVLAALALWSYLVIKKWAIVRVSDSHREESDNVQDSIGQALNTCTANGYTAEECEALLNAIRQTYGEIPDNPGGSSPLEDITSTLKWALIAVVAVNAISAVTKR